MAKPFGIAPPPQAGDFLFSLANFVSIIEPLLKRLGPDSVCEIGVEAGLMTERLLAYCRQAGARYVGIDPGLEEARAAALEAAGAEVHCEPSLAVLPGLAACALYLIDGDHNHYTVCRELDLIASGEGAAAPVILVHDVGWPSDQRDSYYLPSSLPKNRICAHRTDRGVRLEDEELHANGLMADGHYAWRTRYGGARNGVRRAVEDFRKARGAEWTCVEIPGVFGLAVLYRPGCLAAAQAEGLAGLRDATDWLGDFLRLLEYNRLDLYITLGDAVRQRGEAEQLSAERYAALQEQDGLVRERDAAIASLQALVREKDTAVAATSRLVAERDAAIESLQSLVGEKEAAVAATSRLVDERDAALSSLQALVREKEAALAASEALVREKDAAVAATSCLVAERDAALASLQDVVHEKEAALAASEALVREKDAAVAATSRLVDERDAALQDLREHLAGVEQTLRQKEEAVSAQARLIQSRDRTVRDQKRHLDEQQRAMTAMEALIREKDTAVEATSHLVDERDAALAELRAVLAERDARIAEQERCIEATTRLVDEKDAGIEAGNRLVEEKDESIRAQAQMIDDRDSHIALLKDLLEQREALVETQGRTLADREARLAAEAEHIGALARRLEELTTWRGALTRLRRLAGSLLGRPGEPLASRSLGRPQLDRISPFLRREHRRFWWHRLARHDYVPGIYALLSDEEFAHLETWFEETEQQKFVGECSIPFVSLLQGFLMGSAVRNLVQCGHYAGYSTLLTGFVLRKMGCKNALFSVDIDPKVTEFTASWVDRAGLSDYVKVVCNDSAEPTLPEQAAQYFGGPPRVVFIDSSHQYEHTLKELDLWYGALEPGGVLFLHDISDLGVEFDKTEAGGVKRALAEWLEGKDLDCLRLNGQVPPELADAPYADACGLGILQKPY